jgi:hypothetical protein
MRTLGVALWLGLSCVAAQAVELGGGVELHGYGNQDYIETSANTYLGADDLGTWDNNILALVATVPLTEKSKLWAQLESEAAETPRFDWAFVDYQVNGNLRLQFGRAKLPFGVYNEIVDARYLQLSTVPPTVYQDAADLRHDAYQGIGLDYERQLGVGGVLRAQLWGGNTVVPDPEEGLRDRRAFGGKLTWTTPFEGLKLMASAFRIQVEILADGSTQHEDQGVLSLDYVGHGFDIKSEYGKHRLLDEKNDVWYLQAGYTLAGKWTPYVRYDSVSTGTTQGDDPALYQETVVVGLGYKFGNSFSVRVEDHMNRGYALPVASGEAVAGEGKKSWNLLAASVNFIF